VGDVVLGLDENGSACTLTDIEPGGAVRPVIIGIADEVQLT